MIAAVLFLLSNTANAETGTVTISQGYEDGYEEYLGPMSDPSNYWRIHYEWTITSGDPTDVRFSITDFYGGIYGGSSGESSGSGYIQVTEGSYFFGWTNNGYSDLTVNYDIWYEEASPYDDNDDIDPLSEDGEAVACCGGMVALGMIAVLGGFVIIRSRRN